MSELSSYIRVEFNDDVERAKIEKTLCEHCSALLGLREITNGRICRSFDEMFLAIEFEFQSRDFWEDGKKPSNVPLADLPLLPLTEFAKFATRQIGLHEKDTTWMICIDEAEYLPIPYLKVINTILRSEKRPFSLKIATLPYHYQTFETLIEGESVQPSGNDFEFVKLDYDPSSETYKQLTEQILVSRLRRDSNLAGRASKLEDIIETCGAGDVTSIYKYVTGQPDLTPEDLVKITLSHLSETRRAGLSGRKDLPSNGVIKKLRPIALLRELRNIERSGATNSCALSGPRVVRAISAGNPRAFLEIMASLLEAGRQTALTVRTQHNTIKILCSRGFDLVPAVSSQGFLLERIVKVCAEEVSRRLHGDFAVDVGKAFRVSDGLLEERSFQTAIMDGVANGVLESDYLSSPQSISKGALLRLSNRIAAHFWLPFRDGDPVSIVSRQLQSALLNGMTVSANEAVQLHLELEGKK